MMYIVNVDHTDLLYSMSSLGEYQEPYGLMPPTSGFPTYLPDDMLPGRAEVLFGDLEQRVFDKVQSRRGGEAKQRVENGVIGMEAVCQGNILLDVKVWVFREAEAAALHGDKNGRVALPVKMGTHEIDKVGSVIKGELPLVCQTSNVFSVSTFHFSSICFCIVQYYFSVDLDSVFDGPNGKVYDLAKVETTKRNLFQLVVVLGFIDGTCSQEFLSPIFPLRSKPRIKKRKIGELSDASFFFSFFFFAVQEQVSEESYTIFIDPILGGSPPTTQHTPYPTILLPFPSLPFPSLPFPSLPFPSLPFPSLPFPSLPYPTLPHRHQRRLLRISDDLNTISIQYPATVY